MPNLIIAQDFKCASIELPVIYNDASIDLPLTKDEIKTLNDFFKISTSESKLNGSFSFYRSCNSYGLKISDDNDGISIYFRSPEPDIESNEMPDDSVVNECNNGFDLNIKPILTVGDGYDFELIPKTPDNLELGILSLKQCVKSECYQMMANKICKLLLQNATDAFNSAFDYKAQKQLPECKELERIIFEKSKIECFLSKIKCDTRCSVLQQKNTLCFLLPPTATASGELFMIMFEPELFASLGAYIATQIPFDSLFSKQMDETVNSLL